MEAVDKDALICDMQQFYNIDYIQLINTEPLRAAVLACGLRSDSRIIQAITGTCASNEEILLADIADRLGIFIWGYFGKHGRQPQSLRESLIKKKKNVTVTSPEAFKKWRSQFMKEE